MPKRSAGLALFRRAAGAIEVFLVHPGGPFWRNKDDGAWTFPKGEIGPDEDPLAAARREFREETGFDVDGDLIDLGTITQKAGKVVHVFAVEADVDAGAVRSNTFLKEWPPRSGTMQEFPEVDRAGWFTADDARRKLLPAQTAFVDRLLTLV